MSTNISHSGIRLMEYFFSRIQPEKLLSRDEKDNPIIDISWFYSKDLPRDVIQETVVRLLSRNPEYIPASQKRGNNPEKISRISFEKLDGNFSVKFIGADNWTALQVVDDVNKIVHPYVPTVGFLRFQDEIIKTIISKENPDYTPFKIGIGPSLDEGCKNLVSYYRYLMDGKYRELKLQRRNNGIEYMKNYFSALPPEKMFTHDRFDNPIVPLSWFYSKDIPNSVIQKTLARLMSENNKSYEEKVAVRGKKTTDISSVEIHVHDDEFAVRFTGADDWTLLEVVEDVSAKDNRTIPTISLDQLQDEIIKTILSDKSLSLNRSNFAALRNGIGPSLNDACRNLVNYYRTMQIEKQAIKKLNEQEKASEQQENIVFFSGIIDLPEYPGTPRPKNPDSETHSSYRKKTEDIPIEERLSFLNGSKPFAKGTISRKKENGSIDPKAYHAYVYTNNLLQNLPDTESPYGLLFICEPERGDMETRIFYVPQDEYKESVFSHSEISEQALLMAYVQEQLEKTSKDFKNDGGLLLRHRALADYTNRLDFYIFGTVPPKVRSSRATYTERLQRLYNNPNLKIPMLRYTSNHVGELGLLNNTSGLPDKTAQNEINKHAENIILTQEL